MLVVEKGNAGKNAGITIPESHSRWQTRGRSRAGTSGTIPGAVKRHLLSDVPVGILLSGGLDSGLLLALMNEQGGPWPAYTIGYGETFEDDELTDAAETAAALGARHVTVKLDRRRVRTIAAEDRGMFGRTHCRFFHCPDVFCRRACATGCQGSPDRPGPG